MIVLDIRQLEYFGDFSTEAIFGVKSPKRDATFNLGFDLSPESLWIALPTPHPNSHIAAKLIVTPHPTPPPPPGCPRFGKRGWQAQTRGRPQEDCPSPPLLGPEFLGLAFHLRESSRGSGSHPWTENFQVRVLKLDFQI